MFKNQLSINTRNDRGENGLIEALRVEDYRKRRVAFSFLLKCGIDVHNRDITERGKTCRKRLNCGIEVLTRYITDGGTGRDKLENEKLSEGMRGR